MKFYNLGHKSFETDFNVEQEKRFYKNRRLSGSSSFNGTLVRFSIKINDFGFDFHKISGLALLMPVGTSLANAMVIWK